MINENFDGVRHSAVPRTLPLSGSPNSGQKRNQRFSQIAYGNFFYAETVIRNRS